MRPCIQELHDSIYTRIVANNPARKFFNTIPGLKELPPFIVILDTSVGLSANTTKDKIVWLARVSMEAWDKADNNETAIAMVTEIMVSLTSSEMPIANDFSIEDVVIESHAVRAESGDSGGLFQIGTVVALFEVMDLRGL